MQAMGERSGIQRRAVLVTLPAVAVLLACNGEEVETATSATVELTKGGSFTFELFNDDAPRSVANFAKKVRSGFYEGIAFHRVEDWVIQAGDPQAKGELGKDYLIAPDPSKPKLPVVGSGGGTMRTELNSRPFEAGAVGMARGNDINFTSATQFFVLVKAARFLDNEYTNFGRITEGMDVVRGIKAGDTIKRITLQ